MRIIIDVVKKEECRNGDVADYFYEGEDLIIKVTSTGNKFYDRAIAIHELSELSFLESKGVPFSVVDDFDKKCFEENKNEIAYGDQPDCPYKKEHRSAENIERIFIQECGEDWLIYDDIVNNL